MTKGSVRKRSECTNDSRRLSYAPIVDPFGERKNDKISKKKEDTMRKEREFELKIFLPNIST